MPKSVHGTNAIVFASMPLPKPTPALWEWFTEALAATLTTMPTNSRLTLTSGPGRLSGRQVILTMRADHLLAETYEPLDALLRFIPAKHGGVHGGLVDMTSWGGWLPPKRWRGRQRWYRITPLPASLPDLQTVAEVVARAFRFVSVANMPHELIAKSSRKHFDTRLLARLGQCPDTVSEQQLHELLELERRELDLFLKP
ncbi:hypothetical protein [Nocardia sp. NPDC005825]|uniref:TY-Chap domain-containing protein n=1 Tax=unclassified Nocardia TaxID=2637762 RepID=UPI0033D753B3